jgi:hypothetical protein
MQLSSPPDRSALRLWVLFAAMTCMFLDAPAFAQQPPFPITATTAESLSPEQRKQIEDYAKYFSRLLTASTTPQSLVEARERLMLPMRGNGLSPAFRDFYAQTVLAEVRPLAQSQDLVIKMNGLIIASDMPASGVADMAIDTLKDPSAAVRYWAAKAIARASASASAEGSLFSPEQQKKLLATLQEAMPAERSDLVLEQMYQALAGLSIPEAQDVLIKILKVRVGVAAAGINNGIVADQNGFSKLMERLLIEEARGQDVTARLRGLTAVAGQYLQVIAKALQAKAVPDDLKLAANRMVGTCEQILQKALPRLDADHAPGPPLASLAAAERNDELMLNTIDWVGTKDKPGILTSSKINLPFTELQVVPAPAPAPAPSPTPSPAPAPVPAK